MAAIKLTLACGNYDRTRALQFLAMVDVMTPLTVEAVGPKELAAAGDVLRRYADQDLTAAKFAHLVNNRRGPYPILVLLHDGT